MPPRKVTQARAQQEHARALPRRPGGWARTGCRMIWDTCGIERSSALTGRWISVKGMFPPVTAPEQLVALP